MNVTIYRAADAFLYLPTYIAERKKIFHAIDSNLKVDFETPGGLDSGDTLALNSVIECQRSGSDTIPIALCDPLTVFSTNLNNDRSKLRIIGSLVTKPPFWAVNTIKEELNNESEIAKRFNQVIYYNDQLVTGNFIGRRFCRHAKNAKGIPVNFGEEIDVLVREKAKMNGRQTVAVTADLVSLAQGICRKDLVINHRFSKNTFYDHFLTTALVTTQDYCDEYPEVMAKILRGIQGAFVMLRQSKEVAYEVCVDVAKSPESHIYKENQEQMNDKEIRWLVELIHQENFYPASMAITSRQWNAAVQARGKAAMWETEETKEYSDAFSSYVENKFLEMARKSFAREIGFDVDEAANSQTNVLQEFAKVLVGRYAHKYVQWILCVYFALILLFVTLPLIEPQTALFSILVPLRTSLIVGFLALFILAAFWHPRIQEVVHPIASRRFFRFTFYLVMILITIGGWLVATYSENPKIHEWSFSILVIGITQMLAMAWDVIKPNKDIHAE